MATEEYSVGYNEGYQAGWNAALTPKPPSKQDLNQEMLDAFQQWANGERFGDQEELENARLSRNVILAKIKEENNG